MNVELPCPGSFQQASLPEGGHRGLTSAWRRTCNNSMVVQAPHLRFYCSAPLVASNVHRIGTM